MATWTPDLLDTLAATLLPVAADVACSVRDHDADTIAERLAPLDVLQLRALVVVLAAMVPPDRPMDDLIAWTREPPRPPRDITPAAAARNRATLADALGVGDHYQKGAA